MNTFTVVLFASTLCSLVSAAASVQLLGGTESEERHRLGAGWVAPVEVVNDGDAPIAYTWLVKID